MFAGDDLLAGPYRVGEHLGGGGQGEVFRATHTSTQQLVALKRIWLGRDEERASKILSQIQREVDALRPLSDRGIVRVLDWGACPGQRTSRDPLGFAYIAYELVAGSATVRDWLRRKQSLPVRVAEVFYVVAGSVQRLHDRGIYHRDLKPENIMLRGGDWQDPVVIDFGSLRADGVETLTRSGYGHGTVGYMAPEIMAHPKEADLRKADQWSLAKLFTEAFGVSTGLSPHELPELRAPELIEVLREALPYVSKSLRRALSPQPERRFSSLWDMSLHLKGNLERDCGALPFDAALKFRERSPDPGVPGTGREATGPISLPLWSNDPMGRMRHLMTGWSGIGTHKSEEPAALLRLRQVFTGEFQAPTPPSKQAQPESS